MTTRTTAADAATLINGGGIAAIRVTIRPVHGLPTVWQWGGQGNPPVSEFQGANIRPDALVEVVFS